MIFNINKIEEKAIITFNSGYNCAQSVLLPFSDILEFDKKTALQLASGFGAGMGRLQGTCGTVTGAYMVFGLYECQGCADNAEKKGKIYSMIQGFNKKFLQKHQTTDCKSLLNCDLKTEEGQQYYRENNLSETICEPCVKDSVRFVVEEINAFKE